MYVQIVRGSCEATCIINLCLGLWNMRRCVLSCYVLLCSFIIDIGKVRGSFSGGREEWYSMAKE